MARKQKYKLRGLERVLESVPIEDRFAIGAEIRKAFENYDPSNPPGVPVRPIASGTRTCPDCGKPLIEGPVIEEVIEERIRILDCAGCDAVYEEPVSAG